ncbi:fatty acid desaturase family protein [Microbacterium sp. ZW T5_45]|uniref:fatty acid desaturase family protein n=1 Tax=Microbacterium sp. ZW T5_45 TaxID=3378080 RepID=UPI003853DA58
MPPTASSIRRTRPASEASASHGALLKQVRDAGLLRRAPLFYGLLTAGLAVALVAVLAGLALAGSVWVQLIYAALLGVIMTQFAFLGHEASHRQVFQSKRANDAFGRFLATFVVGISYSWWMNKHTRHHANPNRIGFDPDIEPDTIVFQPEHAKGKGRFYSWFLRRQGTLFFPMLLLEGVNLHVQGVRYLLDRRTTIPGREREVALLVARLITLPAFVFAVTSPGAALAVLAVQTGVFGVYMGASFAPNHKGMPQVPSELKLSFLHKQVLTSRNIEGPGMTALLGGLNYQVEHHLFPNMARPHLAQASRIVKDYCHTHGIPYTAVSLLSSYRTVIRHLNQVGCPDRDIFECPMVTAYARR